MTPPTNTGTIARGLEAHAAELEQELGRTYAELAALRSGPTRSPARGRRAVIEDTSAIQLVLASWRDEPTRLLTAAEAHDMAMASGWVTHSVNPLNAMRRALNEAVDGGVVVRVGRGVYMLPVRQEEAESQEEGA